MKKRLFMDSTVAPTEALLRRQLGHAMRFYTATIAAAGNWPRQWQYNHGNGWILKVDGTHKALYYLIAFEGGIEISLTVRDSERTEFLKNKGLESAYPRLEAGTKYAGGYALRFEIENEVDCRSVCNFLAELTRLRLTLAHPLRKKGAKTNEAILQERRTASVTERKFAKHQI